jgi:hypothetical protein
MEGAMFACPIAGNMKCEHTDRSKSFGHPQYLKFLKLMRSFVLVPILETSSVSKLNQCVKRFGMSKDKSNFGTLDYRPETPNNLPLLD